MKKKKKMPASLWLKQNWYKIPRELFLWVNIVIMLFPLYFMVLSAMKTNGEFYNNPLGLPEHGLENLVNNLTMAMTGKVGNLQYTGFLTMLINTTVITLLTLLVMIFVACLAGYALGTRQFKGKGFFTALILAIQIVPFFGYIMPMFIWAEKLHLTNKLLGLLPVYVAVSLPQCIILMQGFYGNFPKAIEEAALLDGCGELKKFFHIVIPMSRGQLGAMAVVNFMGYWNEVAIASLLLNDESLRTINVGVLMTNTQTGAMNYAYVFALLVLSALPNFLFFTIFQKKIIGGVTLGGVKE